MKIRILKNKEQINERWKMGSQSSTQYILEDLFNPASKNNIFNKKLIFYDLETNGFGDAAYVHQIAALEFDLGKIFKKHQDGQSVSNDIQELKATGGIIVKALFDEKDFVDKDEKTRKARNNFYNINFRFRGKKDPVPYSIGNSLMRKPNGGVRFDYDPKNKEAEIIIGCKLCLTEAAWMENSRKVSNVLTGHKKRNTEFDPVTQALIDYCLEKSISFSDDADGVDSFQIKRPWKDNLTMPTKELELFFLKLYELFFTLSNSPYTFTKRRGGPAMQELTTELKRAWSPWKNKAFAFTYTENKNFTEYDKFPLERYRDGYGYDEEEARPNEKQGILKFLKYLKSLGKNKYILIGHNIKAFDNSVINQRSKMHRIPATLRSHFQDSEALDSLNLLNIYTKQMSWFSKKADEMLEDVSIGEKTKEVSRESRRKVQEITKMHKRVKSKLDGMLKVFKETENKTQTHTADDDCEDLARVLSLAVIDMLSMAEAYSELSSQVLVPHETPDMPTYGPKKRTPSQIAPTVKTKFKNDLIQLKIIDIPWAMTKFNKESEKDALDRVATLFSAWISKKYSVENPKLTGDEVMHKLLDFKTNVDTKRAYEQWLLTLGPDVSPPKQAQLDFGLNESISNRWKKMLK
jgi:hypothetical protein